MVYAMLLAHLMGDYVLQTGLVARWKARSLLGVLAHGGIVTATTLLCAVLVDPRWWPYALLIGATHTLIDLVRARFLRTPHPRWELLWYLIDQALHGAIILLVVTWGRHNLGSENGGAAHWLADSRLLLYVIGYILLVNPAWVFLRFAVRGIWGSDAAPRLDQGEKYGPMAERVLIATCVLIGQFYLIPLVLLPRRLVPIRMHGEVGVLLRRPSNWAETILSVSLAVTVGLSLQLLTRAG